MQNGIETKGNRILYLDVMRIIAAFAVITLHTAAQNWYNLDGVEFNFQVFNFYDSIVRFAVPVFVMITGSIMGNNDKTISVSKLWKKNILRFCTAYIFWHFIYVFDSGDNLKALMQAFPSDVLAIWNIFSFSKRHLWFLFMIIFIYSVIPLLRLVTKSKEALKYAINLSLVFSFLIPTLLNLPIVSGLPYLEVVLNFIKSNFYSNTGYHLNFEYIAYFFIGYYLSTVEVDKKMMKKYLAIAVAGWVLTFVISDIGAWYSHESYGFYSNNYINVLMEAVGVYVITKYYVTNHSFKESTIKIILLISEYSFGIYLVHIGVLDMMKFIGVNTLAFNPIFATPIIAVVTFVISFTVSAIIHKIPVLNKYIV